MKKYGTKVASQNNQIRKKASISKGGTGKTVLDYKDEIIKLSSDPTMSVNKISKQLGITRSVLIKFMQELGIDTGNNRIEKRLRTTKEKYGVEYFLQCKEGQQKLKATLKERYGDENPYKNKQYKDEKNKFKKYMAESVL